MSEMILILSTVPDEETGARLAERLVGERLAACVTLSSPCRSVYRWREKIERDREFMLFIKTRPELFRRVEETFAEIHPYEVPELAGLSVPQVSEKYLEWLNDETAAP